jgi:hypothetical protein
VELVRIIGLLRPRFRRDSRQESFITDHITRQESFTFETTLRDTTFAQARQATRNGFRVRMIGIGFAGRLDDTGLADVEQHFALRGARLQAEVSTLADPAVQGQLVARGYLPSGFDNVLGHHPAT